MQIIDTTQLPTVISLVTTWESAILNLAKYCLDAQTSFNSGAATDEQLSLVDITATLTGNEPTCTITLTGVEVDVNGVGKLEVVDDPFSDTNYTVASVYPWNGVNALDTLVNLLCRVFKAEKSTVNNPDNLDAMSIGFSQNTNQNETDFTVDIAIVLPIVVTGGGEHITYTADEYLKGSA
ncbi:MAG: hypothetical protein QNJ68_10330 [Microcoleaceae cyanobacterium MO_207.B10]|nr:hypothetical protein [Microcoleaceae cyanobacterium MO_207.B10]